MNFGVYIHIPYCIQRCHYCDFVTFESSKIPPSEIYVNALCNEIKYKLPHIKYKKLQTIYFGGGTPSLLNAQQIKKILDSINQSHLQLEEDIEITLEVNPATVDKDKLLDLMNLGINRFSLGAQTFNDDLLKLCGREHNAQDTRDTISIFKEQKSNYSFDLLFALPQQKISDLEVDLKEVAHFQPQHVSAYCLTLPQSHFMQINRPKDKVQIQMFELIEDYLKKEGLDKYEISNFAHPGFESRHNLLYWTQQAYLGLGLSAHSYLPEDNLRFWNEKNLDQYLNKYLKEDLGPHWDLQQGHFERLSFHERLTDYCHTFLRLTKGLSQNDAKHQWGPEAFSQLQFKSDKLIKNGLLINEQGQWKLSSKGSLLSNQVFLEFTFLDHDFPS